MSVKSQNSFVFFFYLKQKQMPAFIKKIKCDLSFAFY